MDLSVEDTKLTSERCLMPLDAGMSMRMDIKLTSERSLLPAPLHVPGISIAVSVEDTKLTSERSLLPADVAHSIRVEDTKFID
jgi:hypothetical protein